MTTHEQSNPPESQFEQSIGYLDGCLAEHGRPPPKGEIGGEAIAARMYIDPENTGNRLFYIQIQRMHDGLYTVHHTYYTYVFDPANQAVTEIFDLIPPYSRRISTPPRIADVDDKGQHDVMRIIQDALDKGSVVTEGPASTGLIARLLTAVRQRRSRQKHPKP